MMLFDSHAHYYDEKFGCDLPSVISEIKEAGVKYVINAGTSPETTRMSIALAEENEGFFASAGLHPSDIFDMSDIEAAFDEIKTLALHEKAVAIGEIGLDYHWHGESSERETQKYWFRRQMELAEELSLPVIIHDRDAHGDCFDIVLEYPNVKGVFHSYSGSREMAAELIKRGWYISFSGVITFKNASRLAEIVPSVPNDRILIETDCPYLAPHPFRGERNSSALMVHTAAKAAELRSVPLDEICKITAENAARLFAKAKITV